MLYAFQLGKFKELSLAEIAAIYREKNIEEVIDDHAVVKTSHELTQKDLDRLGGTIKISQIHGKASKYELPEHIAELILKRCDIDTKITYAINIHPISGKVKKFLKSTTQNTKKLLKKQNAKCRFMNNITRDGALNIENIQSKKEILDKKNTIEINLLRQKDEKGNATDTYLISTLVASQDIESYSKRDYDRPHRDTMNGMLPPKLSQILINLSLSKTVEKEPHPDTLIIDPFCGSGGLLLEALLMGYSVQGSDINPKMITQSKNNIKWLIEKFHLSKKADIKIFEHDATQRFPKAKRHALITTEGYLGEAMNRFPDPETIQKNFSHIKQLYTGFFKNLTQMHDSVTVAICIPNYVRTNKKTGRKEVREPKGLIEKITALGFTQSPLLTNKMSLIHHRGPLTSFLYARPEQVVGRNILVFHKGKN